MHWPSRTAVTTLVLLALLALVFVFAGRSRALPGPTGLHTDEGQVAASSAAIIPAPGPSSPQQRHVAGGELGPGSTAGAEPDSPDRELLIHVVSGATGLPIEGVKFGSRYDAVTDRGGTARLWVEIAARPYLHSMSLSAEGFVAKTIQFSVEGWELEAQLTPGVSFEVLVVDAWSGEPVAGAEVGTHQWDEQDESRSTKSQRVTDVDGLAVLPPVYRDLPVRMKLQAKGYVSRTMHLTIEQPGRHTLALGAGGKVSGRLLSFDGASVPGTALKLENAHGGNQSMRTDEQGNFRLAGLALGKPYFLTCSDPPVRSAPFTLTEEQPELWLELRSESSPMTLRVQVRDEQGIPWAGALVNVSRRVSAERAAWPWDPVNRLVAEQLTDETGLAQLELSERGPFELTVSCRGGARATQSISPGPAAEAVVEVVLARGLKLRGRVIDENGVPLAGMVVVYRQVYTRTDEAGEFELAGLSPQAGELVVSGNSRGRATEPTCLTLLFRAGVLPGGERIELQRPAPVMLHGRFTHAPQVTRARWELDVPGYAKLYASVWLDSERSARVQVASSGSAWTLGVRGSGERDPLHVFPNLNPAPGTQVDLGELGIEPKRTISGRVWLPGHTPAAGAAVECYTSHISYSLETLADDQGFFQFKGVPEAAGALWAIAAHGDFSTQVQFENDSDTIYMELELLQETLVHGYVRRADGTALRNCRLSMTSIGMHGEAQGTSGMRTGEDGSFRMTDLDPGTYQIMLQPFGEPDPVLGPRVEVAPGAQLELQVQLP